MKNYQLIAYQKLSLIKFKKSELKYSTFIQK